MQTVRVLIATPIEARLVEMIASVDERLEVIYRADLVGDPRFIADHMAPATRSEAQAREWSRLLADTEILFDVDQPSVSVDLRSRAPNLRWVQATSSGVGEWIDSLGLRGTDVVVTNVAGIHAVPLAEFVVFATAFFAKRIPRVLKAQERHTWEVYPVETLRGKTTGIIGLGHVGREVAKYCMAMGMRVVGIRRESTAKDIRQLGVERLYTLDSLHDMLRECDYLVLSLPLTEETAGLIGPQEFACMKPSSVLINIARGRVVDEDALIDALKSGDIAGAALDVFSVEPLSPTSPLWDMSNVLVTPHNMSIVEDENEAIVGLFCDNLQRYLAGIPLRNVVDKERGY